MKTTELAPLELALRSFRAFWPLPQKFFATKKKKGRRRLCSACSRAALSGASSRSLARATPAARTGGAGARRCDARRSRSPSCITMPLMGGFGDPKPIDDDVKALVDAVPCPPRLAFLFARRARPLEPPRATVAQGGDPRQGGRGRVGGDRGDQLHVASRRRHQLPRQAQGRRQGAHREDLQAPAPHG